MSLDLRSTVQRLQKYSNSSFPILSVYLEVKNDQDLLKEFQATLEHTLVERDYAMLEKIFYVYRGIFT